MSAVMQLAVTVSRFLMPLEKSHAANDVWNGSKVRADGHAMVNKHKRRPKSSV